MKLRGSFVRRPRRRPRPLSVLRPHPFFNSLLTNLQHKPKQKQRQRRGEAPTDPDRASDRRACGSHLRPTTTTTTTRRRDRRGPHRTTSGTATTHRRRRPSSAATAAASSASAAARAAALASSIPGPSPRVGIAIPCFVGSVRCGALRPPALRTARQLTNHPTPPPPPPLRRRWARRRHRCPWLLSKGTNPW